MERILKHRWAQNGGPKTVGPFTLWGRTNWSLMLWIYAVAALAVPAGQTPAALHVTESGAAPSGRCDSGELVLMMQGERPDGKLDWMYKPIVKTLSAGLNASLRTASESFGTFDPAAPYWTIRESVLDQKPKTVSSPKGSIDCGEVARATATLTECDTFIFVGIQCRPDGDFMSALTTRGVHTIYYATEPEECSYTSGQVTEEWHYSLANAHTCRLRADSPTTQRFVPPGYDSSLDILILGEGADAGPCQASAVNMLMSYSHSPEQVGPIEQSLAASGLEMSMHDNVWSEADMRDLLLSQCMYGNVHKDPAQPVLEAVRLATLLSSGCVVISVPAFPGDEEAYAGLVDFAEAQDFGTIASKRAPTAAASREERRNNFKSRFAPDKLFEDAGIHLLLTSLTGRARLSVAREDPA